MRTLIFVSFLIVSIRAEAQSQETRINALARRNGFTCSARVAKAIAQAGAAYRVDPLELTAIAIVETGLGKYAQPRVNRNGTVDRGLFQINTVNYARCVEYNLDTPEGSALCAAKLLSTIRQRRADYLGSYHSKTPSKKEKYLKKINLVLAKNN